MYDWKNKTDEQIADFVIKDHARLKNRRRPYEALWAQIAKLFNPRRYDLLNPAQPGQRFGSQVFSSVPARSAWKYAHGFLAYQVSPAVPWMQPTINNQSTADNDHVKDYLQNFQEQLYSGVSRSSFYSSLPTFLKDWPTIGTGIIVPEYDITNDKVEFRACSPGQCCVGCDQYGNYDVFHREIKMTAKTAYEKFGKESLSVEMVKNAEGANPYAEYDVIYAVYPNGDRDTQAFDDLNKPFMAFEVLMAGTKSARSKLAQKSGVDWFPIVSAMERDPEQEYGTGLAAFALTDALIGNKLGEKRLKAAHLAVEPRMKASGTLRGQVNLNPNGITYTNNATENIDAILDRINWPITDAEMNRIDMACEDWFFVKFFESLNGATPVMTAYQYGQMQGQRSLLMGSLIGTFQKVLEGMLDVIASVEIAAGRMPQVPEELAAIRNPRILYNYLGPFAKLQKSILSSGGILDSMAIMAPILQTWPSAADKINGDELLEAAIAAQGFPQRLIRSDEEVAQIRQVRTAQENQMQQAAMMAEAAKAAPGAGKAIEQNSPLALMGVGSE